MLSIRLTRVGKKKDASFRVVVIDSKEKIQAGNYLEMVGSYDPRVDTATLDAERIKHWLTQGARPSDTVHNLLITKGIIEGKKINVLPRKTVAQKEAEPTQTVAEAAPAEAPTEEVAPAEEVKDLSVNTAEDNAVVEEKPAE